MSYERANNYWFRDEAGHLRGTVRFVADDGPAQGELALDDLVGGELATDVIELGLVVSAVVRRDFDGDTVQVVAVLPRVNVEPNLEAEPFDGLAIVLTQRSSIGGPALVHGALETYVVRQVHGAADIAR